MHGIHLSIVKYDVIGENPKEFGRHHILIINRDFNKIDTRLGAMKCKKHITKNDTMICYKLEQTEKKKQKDLDIDCDFKEISQEPSKYKLMQLLDD